MPAWLVLRYVALAWMLDKRLTMAGGAGGSQDGAAEEGACVAEEEERSRDAREGEAEEETCQDGVAGEACLTREAQEV